MLRFFCSFLTNPGQILRPVNAWRGPYVLLLVLLMLCVRDVKSQEKLSPLFPNKARVGFVGNSITQAGGYHYYLYLFHVTRFPDAQVTFFNCGVGGDTASKILARAEEDIFIHKPDHLTLMVGMNDVNRPLYAKEHSGNSSVEEQKRSAIERYRRDTDELVKLFKGYTTNVILIKPSIYDQTGQLEGENMYGANDALKICGDHIEVLARKYNTGLVDFWTIMNRINAEQQRKNPAFTIVGPDRIHPQVTGHFVMAYQFLKTMNAPAYVARIVIDKDERRSKGRSINCEISGLVRRRDVVSFTCKEGSLPFPAPPDSEEAFSLVPFAEEFNREILQVEDLRDGDYEVRIDDVLIGTHSASDLKAGINLALCQNTPQYQQALKVMERCAEVRRLQSNLRLLKRVEYVDLQKSELELDIDSIDTILKARLELPRWKSRYDFNRRLFSQYVEIKPRAEEIRESIKQREALVFEASTPSAHVFEIRRKK